MRQQRRRRLRAAHFKRSLSKFQRLSCKKAVKMRAWGPGLEIERLADGYVARLKDESRQWSTDTPVSRSTMFEKIQSFGMHLRDVMELLRAVDRVWLQEHPEEDDPEEYFTISKRDSGAYTMISDRRDGWAIQKAESPEGVLAQLVERGFDEADVYEQLAEVESLWERDITSGRSLASVDVERRRNGYVWRGFGGSWVRGRPVSAEELKKMLYFHDQSELDAFIAKADGEWEARRDDDRA